jgi:hypothetical protein
MRWDSGPPGRMRTVGADERSSEPADASRPEASAHAPKRYGAGSIMGRADSPRAA